MNQQNRDRLIGTENGLIAARGVRRLREKDEEIKKYKLVVTKSSWDVKDSIGNMVNNIVITMYGARGVLEISGEITL